MGKMYLTVKELYGKIGSFLTIFSLIEGIYPTAKVEYRFPKNHYQPNFQRT